MGQIYLVSPIATHWGQPWYIYFRPNNKRPLVLRWGKYTTFTVEVPWVSQSEVWGITNKFGSFYFFLRPFPTVKSFLLALWSSCPFLAHFPFKLEFLDWVIFTCSLSPSLMGYSSVKVKVAQSCLTLRPHTVHGILQASILEWVSFPFSRGSSQTRDWTHVSHIAGGFFTNWATRETQEYWNG